MNKKINLYPESIEEGAATPAILVIAATLTTALLGILLMIAVQLDLSHRQLASEKALNIAEAGVDYFKWHFIHDENDFTSGTYDYSDPLGEIIGQYQLEIEPPSNQSPYITIRSTGWTTEQPNNKRTIRVQYGKQSLAKYSFLSNASIWHGAGTLINGELHSNNGIRMDGTSNSIVSSSQTTYHCGWETGCEPAEWKSGVWGTGGNQSLWKLSQPVVDFDSVTLDLSFLMQESISQGLYLEPSKKGGYHIVFQENGTFTVYTVTATDFVKGYIVPGLGLGGGKRQGGCKNRYILIKSEQLLGNYSLEDIPLIFVEDDVWVEGVVNGRVTIASTTFPISSSQTNIMIPGNITYTDYDGSSALGLISQSDIIFTRDVPDNFEVNAVLMSQGGNIIRHGYTQSCGGNQGAVKQKLTINGSIISFEKAYWNYNEGPESGFIQKELNYDSDLIYNPPPYFPTFGDYELVSWKEE